MTHRVTIELPDSLYRPIAETAQRRGSHVEDVIVEKLRAASPERAMKAIADESDDRGLSVLLKYAGCISTSHPRGADNDAIDEDLAREYGSIHDDEE